MDYLTFLLPVLLTGIAILMVGILIIREPKQSRISAFLESLAWGGGLFVTYTIEILTFSNI